MTTEHHLALPDGYVLNEYRIERMLGHGGFGITYLACEDRLQRRVAIKEYLPNDLAWREEDSHVVPRSRSGKSSYELGLRQFLHEARTLAQFSHPNIVQVLTFFEANGTAYIVMCYERGKSLHEHLKERGGTLPTPELLRLAKALMDGLGAVHEAHFLHRDLKPGNIFLRADGRPLLLDFGAARQTIGEATRSVAAVFTHGYAAPEQYHIGSKQGPSTDIYGLGAVFYHCIAGRPPPDAAERFLAHGAREPDPLRPAAEVGWGRYPEAFLSAVDQCLDVVAGRRPQSIADLRRRVFPDGVTDDEPRRRHEAPEGRASRKDRTVAMDRAATTGTVPEERQGSTGPSRGQGAARRRLALSAGALATVISAASLGAVYSRWDRENRTTPQIVADWGPLEEASFNAARAALHVSTLYGRERHRRMRHEQALPALERLAQSKVRYQKQLEDVREGIHRLDKEIDAHLREYLSLVGTLAADPERFGRIKPKLLELELPDAGKVARRHLVGHVEGAPRAGADATQWRASLDASYSSADLW